MGPGATASVTATITAFASIPDVAYGIVMRGRPPSQGDVRFVNRSELRPTVEGAPVAFDVSTLRLQLSPPAFAAAVDFVVVLLHPPNGTVPLSPDCWGRAARQVFFFLASPSSSCPIRLTFW